MSFGTFSSRYGSEPEFDLDMGIEADHPFTFSEGEGFDSFMIGSSPGGDTSAATAQIATEPPLDSEAAKGIGIQLPQQLQELPWSMILPAALIGVVAVGIGWYLTGGKMPDIPV